MVADGGPGGRKRLEEDEIAERVDALRTKLLAEMEAGAGRIDARALKPHQVHELAAAKMGLPPPPSLSLWV